MTATAGAGAGAGDISDCDNKCCLICGRDHHKDLFRFSGPQSQDGDVSLSHLLCLLDNKETNNNNSKTAGHVVLASGYIYCHGMCSGPRAAPSGSFSLSTTTTSPSGPSSNSNAIQEKIQRWTCRSSKKMDPGYEALAELPYVHDLLLIDHLSNPSPSDADERLLKLMYQEWSLREMQHTVESMEKQQSDELKKWKQDRDKEFSKRKKQLEHAAAASASSAAASGKKNKKGATVKVDVSGKLIKELNAAIDAEFEPRRKLLEAKHKHENQTHLYGAGGRIFDETTGTTMLDQIKSDLGKTAELVTKAVQKHYRRASIKVHPDRHGPEFQSKFDDLTKAKDTLQDKGLREKYVDHLMPIISTFGTNRKVLETSESPMLISSHFEWIKKHQPDFIQQQQKQQQKPKKDDDGVRRIEGGLIYTKPRKPHVSVVDDKERRIRVVMRIPPNISTEFHERWQKIYIHQNIHQTLAVRHQQQEERKPVITPFTRSTIKENDGTSDIEIELTIPEDGIWDVSWKFEIEIGGYHGGDGTMVTLSELSDVATVDIRPYFHARVEELKSFERLAKRHMNTLKSSLNKLSSASLLKEVTTDEMEAFQRSMLKAKQTRYNLKKAMKIVGVSTSRKVEGFSDTTYGRLVDLLQDAKACQERVVATLHERERHAAKKNFKESVYRILEVGDGGQWVEDLSEEELQQKGGDSNRLYQLLMEGKKAYRVDLVDASVLLSASNRSDLFSQKQARALTERAEHFERQATEEARRVYEEETKKEEEEKAQTELERYASQFERGELLQIQGLKKQTSFNGRFVFVMGIHFGSDGQPTGRFEVKLVDDDRQLALLTKNLVKSDKFMEKAKVDPWACLHCTYLHEDDEAKLESCAMCGGSRHGSPPEQSMLAMDHSTAGHSHNKSQSDTHGNYQKTSADKLPVQQKIPPSKSKASTKQQKRQTQAAKSKAATKQQNDTSSNSSTKQPKRQDQPAQSKTGANKNNDSSSDSSTRPNKQNQHEKSKAATEQRNGAPSRTSTKGSKQQNRPVAASSSNQSRQQSKKGTQKAPVSVTGNKGSKSTPASSVTESQLTSTTSSDGQRAVNESVDSFVRNEINCFPSHQPTGDVAQPTVVYGRTGVMVGQLHNTKLDDLRSVDHTAISGDSIFDMARRTAASLVSPAQVPAQLGNLSFPSSDESYEHSQLLQQDQLFPSQSTLSNGGSGGRKDEVLLFLESHEKALKCSPSDFAEWLQSEDVATMEDLADACNDEDFVSELVNHGLKKFKLSAFRKSAASHHSSF